jgi:hypothetical protein
MEVQFRRTGERRYTVVIFRKDHPAIEMNPAPGYDPVLPHDLLHLVVEREIGLRHGIFGQIAAGGNAGTFHPIPATKGNKREAARLRRRASRRGDKLLREGRDELEISERAADICFNEWLSRSNNPARMKMADRLPSRQKHMQGHRPADDGDMLSGEVLDRICACLDDVSARWAALEPGGSLTVVWPD